MDCLDSSTSARATELLTQADQIAKLEKLFSKYRHKADVFLPGEDFYNDITGAEDAERMAEHIFKWLGIKHHSLEIHIDPGQEQLLVYSMQKGTSRVALGRRCLKDPFLCGAAVAHGITHHLLLSRSKIQLKTAENNEALTDLGTIYAGLCVLILNSFEGKSGVLGSMAQANYIAECMDYFDERRIVGSIWQPYVLPAVVAKKMTSKYHFGTGQRYFI